MSAAANDPVFTAQRGLESRRAFEAAMWEYYRELKALGWSAPEEGDFTPEALFWRTDTGLYGVKQIQAAWTGWLLAVKNPEGGAA